MCLLQVQRENNYILGSNELVVLKVDLLALNIYIYVRYNVLQ